LPDHEKEILKKGKMANQIFWLIAKQTASNFF